jgi:MYXO-CTERM domain-containing protein
MSMKSPLSVLALMLASTSSLASSSYPGEMASHLGGETRPPSCTVCHASNAGGFGTVTKAHGISLMDAGLVAGSATSLQDALDALESAGTDSDGGGVADIAELRAGTDPNVADDDGGDGGDDGGGDDTLQYGFCAATPAQGGGLGGLFALGFALALRRRR